MTTLAPTKPRRDDGARWSAFLVVCLAYLAVTTGEAVLAPVYPVVAHDIGLNLTQAGLVFAVLATSIAVFNTIGGLLLRHLPTTVVLAGALATSGLGGAMAATASGSYQFFLAQVLLGAGAGSLYSGAVMSVGDFAGSRRRGFAMGIFGVFFSGGLVLAAGLATLGSRFQWRWIFGLAAVLAATAAAAVLFVKDAPRAKKSGPVFAGLRAVLGVPTAVGIVGGISQYATVSFLPVFAVDVWGVSGAGAAGILVIGRVLSVPAKLMSGAAADRHGPVRTAQGTGIVLTAAGLVWALSPWVAFAAIAAIVFAAEVSALFPLANLLALDRAGEHGPALGAFRSLQLGAGAIAGVGVGASADTVGLRPTVAVVSTVPLLLLLTGLMATKPIEPI